MTYPSKPPGELVHHGVKGMKWGVRRSNSAKDAPHPNYTPSQRSYDRKNLGKGGVKRVNRRLNEGQNLKTARKNELKRKLKVNAAITVAALGAHYGPKVYPIAKLVGTLAMEVVAHGIAQRAETKRGEAWVRNAFSESNGLRGTPNTSKRRRDGSYNISSMGR